MKHRRRRYQMTGHPIRAIFFLGMAVLQAAGIAGAGAERELLLKKSAQLRDAVIIADHGNGTSNGCFIGKDGLAVFDLMTFAGLKAPKQFVLMNRTRLKPPILRYISADLGIAIADFDYLPTVVIEPSSKTIPLELRVAILDCDVLSEVPVVAIGPVKSRAKFLNRSYVEFTYDTQFSIGAGLPAGREKPFGPGAPVIDSNGKLRGTFGSIRPSGHQTLLYAIDASLWFAEVAKARSLKESIKYPLPAGNPVDHALYDPAYTKAVDALLGGEDATAIKHVQAALKIHGDSPLLHSFHFDQATREEDGDFLALAEATKPPSGGTDAAHVSYLSNLAWARSKTGDQEGAKRAYLEAIELAPKELKAIRQEYGMYLWKNGNPDPEAALPYLREAANAAPEDIQTLEYLVELLTQLGKWDEADKVSDRILEYEELYKPTTSASLRPKRN